MLYRSQVIKTLLSTWPRLPETKEIEMCKASMFRIFVKHSNFYSLNVLFWNMTFPFCAMREKSCNTSLQFLQSWHRQETWHSPFPFLLSLPLPPFPTTVIWTNEAFWRELPQPLQPFDRCVIAPSPMAQEWLHDPIGPDRLYHKGNNEPKKV